jgi:hypothetical protein
MAVPPTPLPSPSMQAAVREQPRSEYVDDAIGEGTETATLTLSNPSSGISLGSTITQNITITDNEPYVTISLSSSNFAENSGKTLTITATASATSASNQTVSISVTGTGITASDYTLANTTITILAGNTTGTQTLTLQNDNILEGDETMTLTSASPSSGIWVGTPSSANFVINDDDMSIPMSSLGNPTSTITFDELGNSGTGLSVFPAGCYSNTVNGLVLVELVLLNYSDW